MKRTVRVLSKNVKRMLDTLKDNCNYLDFEEDYDFLTHEEKQELFAILGFSMAYNENVEYVEV